MSNTNKNEYLDDTNKLVQALCQDATLMASIEKVILKRFSRNPHGDSKWKKAIIDETVSQILAKIQIVELVKKEKLRKLQRPLYSDSEPQQRVLRKKLKQKTTLLPNQLNRNITQKNINIDNYNSNENIVLNPESPLKRRPLTDLGSTQTLTMDYSQALLAIAEEQNYQTSSWTESQQLLLQNNQPFSGLVLEIIKDNEQLDSGVLAGDAISKEPDMLNTVEVIEYDDPNSEGNFEQVIDVSRNSDVEERNGPEASAYQSEEGSFQHDYSDDWDTLVITSERAEGAPISSKNDRADNVESEKENRVRFANSIVSDVFLSRYKYDNEQVAELFFTREEGLKFQLDFDREFERASAENKEWIDWIMERTEEQAAHDDACDLEARQREIDWDMQDEDPVYDDNDLF